MRLRRRVRSRHASLLRGRSVRMRLRRRVRSRHASLLRGRSGGRGRLDRRNSSGGGRGRVGLGRGGLRRGSRRCLLGRLGDGNLGGLRGCVGGRGGLCGGARCDGLGDALVAAGGERAGRGRDDRGGGRQRDHRAANPAANAGRMRLGGDQAFVHGKAQRWP
ncbi:hypothetical protein [Conexibacter arvalis]|uniref:Uncharacterized protein n=1 Tax=Conexibacter arvalis TaxID=912552 RepID=A0A840IHN4_9ACTN|nr:hypothetical protein [Conexibacter arvalis]MBB4664462.1 hypothetical protein [Conexibacter arvalis]